MNSTFLGAATELEQLTPHEYPEIALIGRSNVGKSTLLNKLTGRRALARVSSTPGRTQAINLFKLEKFEAEIPLEGLILADLPGFGYARFSKDKRMQLSQLVVEYLRSRTKLSAVCLLCDVRRRPEADELAVQAECFANGVILIPVVTKVDKISKSELKQAKSEIAKAYGLESEDLLEVGSKQSIGPLWQRIVGIVQAI